MADTKISALPTATTIAGAAFPVVQGGVNKQAPATLFTPAAIGAATSAQGAKADSALQSGAVALTDVVGLQTALDGKSDTSHLHASTYQPLDADLTAIAALATNGLVERTGAGTCGIVPVTSAAKTLLDDASASAMRTTLGLVLGTDAQAYDAKLAAIAGLTGAADKVAYFTGATTVDLTTFTASGRALVGLSGLADRVPYFNGDGTASTAGLTAAGRALIDDADAAAQRTTLGLGTAATTASTAYATAAQGTLAGTALQPNVDIATAMITATKTTEQLRLGYDATKYASFAVDSVGDLSVSPSGTKFSHSGTSAVDGTSPVTFEIRDIRTSSSWSSDAEFARLGFFSTDASGTAGVARYRATIGVTQSSSSGAGGSLVFRVDDWVGAGLIERARLDQDGKFGVGTGATVSAKAHVVSTTEQLRLGYDATTYYSFITSSACALSISPSVEPNFGFRVSSVGRCSVISKDASYALGVNNSNGSAAYIIALNSSEASLPVSVTLEGYNNYDSGLSGCGIIFRGRYNAGGSSTPMGLISCVKENTTDGVYASALVFASRSQSSSLAEKMRITSAGQLAINVTSASAKLHVIETTEQLRIGYDATKYASFTVNSGGDLLIAPTGSLKFGTWATSADAAVNGYIAIKDAGGTVRKLATIA
jgi:hypothetical protein